MRLLEYMKENVLLADGAMGTYYRQKYQTKKDAEEANLFHPERIVEIHREYIEAGARLIRTNTFGVNPRLFPGEGECEELIAAAVSSARIAAEESGKEIWIGASIGPMKQMPEDSDESLEQEYQRLVDAFLKEGIDIFVFETFSELRWIPVLAQYCKRRCGNCTVIAQFSLNPTGYTQYGYSIDEIVEQMSGLEWVDVFGFNCGVGVSHLRKLLSEQEFCGDCLLSALPNAGYQQELRGQMRYSDRPEYYAEQMEELLKLGVNLVGGCCGTTPEHIAILRERTNDRKVQPKKLRKTTAVRFQAAPQLTPFVRKLQDGREKVFVVELDAPFDAQMDKFRKGIFALKRQQVDMITVSDSPLARSRADASLLAVYAKHLANVPVMPHVAMRDRNLIGLRSEVLGAYVSDIRDFLVITGDPVGPENQGKITGVFDMNSIRFMDYLKHMNEEVFGEFPVCYGGALNYAGVNVDSITRRMRQKMDAGCAYFLTQPVFSEWDVQRIRELKELTGAKIICGLMPIVSYRNAMFLQNEMPGIHVDDEIVSKYHPDMTREEAEETAVCLSVEIADKLYDVADGFYLMTPFHRVALVSRIIDEIKKWRNNH